MNAAAECEKVCSVFGRWSRSRPARLGARQGAIGVGGVSALLLPLQSRVAHPLEATALIAPVLFAAVLGGWRAVAATALLGTVVLAVLFPPYWSLGISSPSDRLMLLGYLLVGGGAGMLTHVMADHSRRLAFADRSGAVAFEAPLPPSVPHPSPAPLMRPLNAVFSHHKCGTSWASGVITACCDELHWSYRSTPDAGLFGGIGMEQWAFEEGVDVLMWSNATIALVPPTSSLRAVHIIRDPRDMCVSGYFSHRNSHRTDQWPRLVDHQARLRGTDINEGLALEIDFLGTVFGVMEEWDYTRPNILELRFEDLVADPEGRFMEIAAFFGMTGGPHAGGAHGGGTHLHASTEALTEKVRRRLYLPPSAHLTDDDVRRIVKAHSFEVMSGGRARGTVDVDSHYRSGTPGDWRRYMTADHLALFDRTYPTLLDRLGYPASP